MARHLGEPFQPVSQLVRELMIMIVKGLKVYFITFPVPSFIAIFVIFFTLLESITIYLDILKWKEEHCGDAIKIPNGNPHDGMRLISQLTLRGMAFHSFLVIVMSSSISSISACLRCAVALLRV